MSTESLPDRSAIERFYARDPAIVLDDPDLARWHEEFLLALEEGILRAAWRHPDGAWAAVPWVKKALLIGFSASTTEEIPGWSASAFDRTAFPPRRFLAEDRVRLVPGGSAVRRGAHLAPGVIVMPPAYVNVGAYVGSGTMIDSHALVGSCAQIGQHVHLSAGAQIGGVLEPALATPVVVEDEAFIGGLAGLFEGVVVRRRAVVAPGVIISGSTTIYDLVRGRSLAREVPEGAVVVPGSRPARGRFAASHSLSLSVPCIVKYRDDRTAAATALEEALR